MLFCPKDSIGNTSPENGLPVEVEKIVDGIYLLRRSDNTKWIVDENKIGSGVILHLAMDGKWNEIMEYESTLSAIESVARGNHTV